MPIGVIGTGAMGAGMAANLLDHGQTVFIRDIDPERERPLAAAGAHRVSTPGELVASARAIFVVVETAGQIDAVLDGPHGLLAGLDGLPPADRAGRTVFFCSTIAPDDTERFCAAILGGGADAIDAPISGGPARARDGTMSMMLAAPAAVLERQQDLIGQLASRSFRVSARHGDGARAKLANNLAAGAYLAAASEALAMAERMGLDTAIMQALMAASSGQSWVADDRLPRALAGAVKPVGAATRVLNKDLTLAVAAARQAGAPVPMGEAALARFTAALAAGLGDHDDSSLFSLYRDPSRPPG